MLSGQLLGVLRAASRMHVRDHDRHSVLGELSGDRRTDPGARRGGHHCNFSIVHSQSLSCSPA